MTKSFVRRDWVLPIASAIPALAVVYAFSLGPAPAKALSRFYALQGPEEALHAPLAAGGPEMLPMLLSELRRPDMPHRRTVISFIAQRRHAEAWPVLAAIVDDDVEATGDRAAALRALHALDAPRAAEVAEQHLDREDSLGAAAREVMGRAPPARPVMGAAVLD